MHPGMCIRSPKLARSKTIVPSGAVHVPRPGSLEPPLEPPLLLLEVLDPPLLEVLPPLLLEVLDPPLLEVLPPLLLEVLDPPLRQLVVPKVTEPEGLTLIEL